MSTTAAPPEKIKRLLFKEDLNKGSKLIPKDGISLKNDCWCTNPLELLDIIEVICLHLNNDDLKTCQFVNSIWQRACQKEQSVRKIPYSCFRYSKVIYPKCYKNSNDPCPLDNCIETDNFAPLSFK